MSIDGKYYQTNGVVRRDENLRFLQFKEREELPNLTSRKYRHIHHVDIQLF